MPPACGLALCSRLTSSLSCPFSSFSSRSCSCRASSCGQRCGSSSLGSGVLGRGVMGVRMLPGVRLGGQLPARLG